MANGNAFGIVKSIKPKTNLINAAKHPNVKTRVKVQRLAKAAFL